MLQKPLRVAVVGTTFGAYYIRAIEMLSTEFELVAIVAAGSEASIKCAQRYDVPLYRYVEELPDNIDLICVTVRTTVTGGPGTEIAKSALNKGFSVLVEAPMHHSDIAACYELAALRQVSFKLGDMYPQTVVSSRFIEIAREILRKNKKPIYINLKTSVQVYLNAIRLLLKIIHNIEEIEVKTVTNQGAFSVITASLLPLEIPLTLELNDEMMPGMPDSFFHLLHAAEIYFDGGRLSMTDTYGTVFWHNRMNFPSEYMRHGYENFVLADGVAKARSYHMIGNSDNVGEIYNLLRIYEWPRAIGEELKQIKRMIEGNNTLFHRENHFDIKAAQLWSRLTTTAGYPKINRNMTYEFYEPECVAEGGFVDEEI